MPFRIQRVPQGLNNLLSIFGGATPNELEDRVRPTIEALQFYALQQRQLLVNTDAALAELGVVACTSAAFLPLRNQYCLLFGASGAIVKTGTMTAGRLSVEMARQGQANSISLGSEEVGPFGATETGAATVAFWAPYPILLVPPWDVFVRLQILGTDATAQVTAIAEIGVLQ